MTFINPRAKTLRHLDRLAAWQAGQRPAPVTVEWDLSNRCTLGCQDCHFAHTHSRGPWTSKPRTLPMAFEGTGDLADADLVIRALSSMVDAGVKGIIWSGGGEPTTHPEWMRILAYAHNARLQQGMYTLGALNEPLANVLGSITEWVVVSLDCADGATYAREKGVPADRFEAACNGIRWLSAAKRAAIGVSFLLHGGNYTQAWKMLDLARALGATYTTFRPAIRVSADRPSHCADDRRWIACVRPMFEQLAAEKDVEIEPARFEAYAGWTGHGYSDCLGVRLNTTITPDGRLWLCPQRRGVGQPLGDLREESFAAIWARHPGHQTVDADCRVMCRLHPVNQTLAALARPVVHEAFV